MSSSNITRSRPSKRPAACPPSFAVTHSYSTRLQKRRKLNFDENLDPYPTFDTKDIHHSNHHSFDDNQEVPVLSAVDNLTFDPTTHCGRFYSNAQVKRRSSKPKLLRIISTPKGAFQLLPNELIHLILSFLDCSGLGALGLASTQMCDIVRNYVYTLRGMQQIFPPPPVSSDDEVNPDDFRKLGKLLKQLSLLHPIRSRLKTASFFLTKLEPTHVAICDYHGTNESYECFGKLFTTFVSGWEDLDKTRAYCIVKTSSKLEERVNKVLRSVPGSLPYHEKDIRLFHRNMFLSHSLNSDKEYAFWLTQILKPWPITFQARLLYILTAPEDDNGYVSWSNLCACPYSTSVIETVCDFSELGRSLRVMDEFRGCKDWNKEDIISIIEELTITPSGWSLENVAYLLLSCGQNVAKGFLGCRAVSGQVDELAILFCCLANSVNKKLYPELWDSRSFIKVLGETMQLFPSYVNKTDFLSSMMDTWKECISDLFEDFTSDNLEYGSYTLEVQQEFHSVLESLRNFALSMLEMNLMEKTSH